MARIWEGFVRECIYEAWRYAVGDSVVAGGASVRLHECVGLCGVV